MLHDAGNEISSYAERTRGRGLSTTRHYAYLFLLTGSGIFLIFFFPSPLPSLDTHDFSSAGITSQCAASSPWSVSPAGTRRPAPARTPGSSHPWGPGGNTAHPLPSTYPAGPLNGSTCQTTAEVWLLAGRFSAWAAVPTFGEKAGYWTEAVCISDSDLPSDGPYWPGIQQFQERARCSVTEDKAVHLK